MENYKSLKCCRIFNGKKSYWTTSNHYNTVPGQFGWSPCLHIYTTLHTDANTAALITRVLISDLIYSFTFGYKCGQMFKTTLLIHMRKLSFVNQSVLNNNQIRSGSYLVKIDH